MVVEYIAPPAVGALIIGLGFDKKRSRKLEEEIDPILENNIQRRKSHYEQLMSTVESYKTLGPLTPFTWNAKRSLKKKINKHFGN